MKNPYLKRMNKVRKRSLVTCPASRHAAMIAEALIRGDDCPMLFEDPLFCSETIAAIQSVGLTTFKATSMLATEAQTNDPRTETRGGAAVCA